MPGPKNYGLPQSSSLRTKAPEQDEPSAGRRYGAAGIRTLASILSAEGLYPGAVISGLGEAGAELVEGSPLNPARIGAEMVLGAVPLGKVFKAGKIPYSMVRGGLYSGVGETAREASQAKSWSPEDIKESLNPTAIAQSGGLGALLGGALSRFQRIPKSARPKPTSPETMYEVTPTAQVGEGTGVLTGGKIAPPTRTAGAKTVGGTSKPVRPIEPIPSTARAATPLEKLKEAAPSKGKAAIPYGGPPEGPAPYRGAAKQAQKEAANQTRLDEIREMIAEGGLRRGGTSIGESLSAKGSAGETLSARTSYKAPKFAEGQSRADLEDEIAVIKAEIAARKAASPLGEFLSPKKPDIAAAGGDTPDHLNPLVKLSRGWSREQKMERMQTLYSPEAQTAINAEAAVYNNPATTMPNRRAAGARMAGLAQEEEARLTAQAAEGQAGWVEKQSGIVDKLAELARQQKGEISPGMIKAMSSATGGAVGAAAGAAADDENPWQGALTGGLAGAALGAAAPMVATQLAKLGTPKEIVAEAGNPAATPKGILDRVKSAWELFPQYQRFSYLADEVGLPANALVGPYGSAFFGALEHRFAGDARGAAALKLLSPDNFLEEYGKAIAEILKQGVKSEAASLIGRAEGHALTGASTRTEKILASPGVIMTAGDVASRRLLMKAGFSEAEARTITLTSEPVLPFGKFLANAGRKSTLLQMLFPFRRTPANIMEQGAERIPGLGSIINSYKPSPDSLKLQAIKQAMGLGVMGASGAAGASVDPETAKWLRRYVSNAGGQYSLPASMGFAAGQAYRNRRPMAKAIGTSVGYALPLPSAEPAVDWTNYIFSGGPLGDAPLPRGAVPTVLRKLFKQIGDGNYKSDALERTATRRPGPRNYGRE